MIRFALFCMCFCMAWRPVPLRAEHHKAGGIQPRAIEVGAAGAITSIEGTTQVSFRGDVGTFRALRYGLIGGHLESVFRRVRDSRKFDLQGGLSWTQSVASAAVWPYVSLGGGVQTEFVGSFSITRYPLGFQVGLRTLLSSMVALRTEYRFRRFLEDPVRNFNQHELAFGVSILFRNAAR